MRYSSAAGRWVLAATVLGSAMASIDSTVVGIALPSIGRDLGALLILDLLAYLFHVKCQRRFEQIDKWFFGKCTGLTEQDDLLSDDHQSWNRPDLEGCRK